MDHRSTDDLCYSSVSHDWSWILGFRPMTLDHGNQDKTQNILIKLKKQESSRRKKAHQRNSKTASGIDGAPINNLELLYLHYKRCRQNGSINGIYEHGRGTLKHIHKQKLDKKGTIYSPYLNSRILKLIQYKSNNKDSL